MSMTFFNQDKSPIVLLLRPSLIPLIVYCFVLLNVSQRMLTYRFNYFPDNKFTLVLQKWFILWRINSFLTSSKLSAAKSIRNFDKLLLLPLASLVICRNLDCLFFLKRRYKRSTNLKSQKNTLFKRSVLYESQSRKLEHVESGTEATIIRSNQQ